MLIFCDFIQVYVFSTNHHLKTRIQPYNFTLYIFINVYICTIFFYFFFLLQNLGCQTVVSESNFLI